VGVIVEYLHLWDILSAVTLQSQEEDKHIWKFSANAQYSAKSAYESFFIGATSFGPWERIWKSWAPPKCRFFLWLVAHNRCWTADRLQRRGLPRPACCPLCDQAQETINHILVGCAFAREFWFHLFRKVGLQPLTPQLNENSFLDWWERVISSMGEQLRQGTNSLIILGAWTLWNHRSLCL